MFRSNLSAWLSKTNYGDLPEIISVNEKRWICVMCSRYLRNRSLPPYSVLNGVKLNNIPQQLRVLNSIEEKSVAKRCPFVNIFEKPVGQICCASGVINVPNHAERSVSSIPRNIVDDLLLFNLKRRMSDRKPYIAKYGKPSKVIEAARTLIDTPLMKLYDVSFDETWKANGIDQDLLTNLNEVNADFDVEGGFSEEALPDNQQEFGNNETLIFKECFKPEINKSFNYAPCEDCSPLAMYSDEHCEDLSYPSLFGGQPRQPAKHIPLTYGDHCIIEMRHRNRMFARHTENICFKVKKLQIQQVFSKANFAMKNVQGKPSCAGELENGGVFSFLKSNKGYDFLKNQRLSQPYFANMKRNCFAWARQLGKATIFQTFSMPEAHWPDLLRILHKGLYPNSRHLSDRQLLELPPDEKLKLVQSDPVAIVRFFDHKVAWFLLNVLQSKDSPIGEVTDYFGCVEASIGDPYIFI